MPRHVARLSVADQVAPYTHTTLVQCIRSDDPVESARLIGAALRKTAQHLPYLRGYISRDSEQHFSTLTWGDDDPEVEFKELQCPSLPSYDTLKRSGMGLHRFPYNLNPPGCVTRESQSVARSPVLLVSYTIIQGGLILSISPHHQLTDGVGQFHLIRYWADVAAGRESKIQLDPLAPLRRFEHVNRAIGVDEAKMPAPKPAQGPPATPPVSKLLTSTPVHLASNMFTFRVDQVQALARRLPNYHKKWPPSVDLLLSVLMWCLVARVKHSRKPATAGDESAKTRLLMPVNVRKTLWPRDSTPYVGNCLAAAVATESISILARSERGDGVPEEISHALDLVDRSLQALRDPDTIKTKLRQILQLPDARVLHEGGVFGADDIFCSMWTNLTEPTPVSYGAEAGEVEFLRPAVSEDISYRASYAYLLILPRRVADAGDEVIDVFTRLEVGDAQALEEHPFLKAFAV